MQRRAQGESTHRAHRDVRKRAVAVVQVKRVALAKEAVVRFSRVAVGAVPTADIDVDPAIAVHVGPGGGQGMIQYVRGEQRIRIVKFGLCQAVLDISRRVGWESDRSRPSHQRNATSADRRRRWGDLPSTCS